VTSARSAASRRLRALAALIQDGATLVGPEVPWVWSLVELATKLEREAHLLEAALEPARRAA
jgi:hypothetical protein